MPPDRSWLCRCGAQFPSPVDLGTHFVAARSDGPVYGLSRVVYADSLTRGSVRLA